MCLDIKLPLLNEGELLEHESILEVIDNLNELINTSQDKSRNKSSNDSTTYNNSSKVAQIYAYLQDIPKPQELFLTEIDNTRTRPFKPRITKKYNSLVPLNLTELPLVVDNSDFIGPNTYFSNPYEYELNNLKYPEWLVCNPLHVQPWNPSPQQPFQYIDNIDDLHILVDDLKDSTEIAVDLEHHSIRSFQGITCLMQISSRDSDYIIDTIKLRAHMNLLLPVFSNPRILKVFHGCDSDISWLQRDFGLYVVNCFDTYFASKLLNFPSFSLAYLLNTFVGIKVNKKYQLADWRQRPLPDEMLQYAKGDTHHLLFIFDCLRIKLWQKYSSSKGIEHVLDSSKNVCLQRYEKSVFNSSGYKSLVDDYSKQNGVRTTELQIATIAALYNWRDLMARKLDESVLYIMSNDELIRIGTNIPQSTDELEVKCSPYNNIISTWKNDIIKEISNAISISAAAVSYIGSTSKQSQPTSMGVSSATKIKSPMDVHREQRSLPYQLQQYQTIYSFVLHGQSSLESTNKSCKSKITKIIDHSSNFRTKNDLDACDPLTKAIEISRGANKVSELFKSMKSIKPKSRSVQVEPINDAEDSFNVHEKRYENSTDGNETVYIEVTNHTRDGNLVHVGDAISKQIVVGTSDNDHNYDDDELPVAMIDKYHISSNKMKRLLSNSNNLLKSKKIKLANNESESRVDSNPVHYDKVASQYKASSSIGIGVQVPVAANNTMKPHVSKKAMEAHSAKKVNPYLNTEKTMNMNKDVARRDVNKKAVFKFK